VLYRLLHRSAEAIIAVSDGVADDLAAVTGIDRARITTIYNPVIDRHFHDRAGLPCSENWLQDRSCPVLVFAGRLSPQKDPQTLLQAFALLLTAMPARLLILGDGPLRASLDAEVDRLGISSSVAFAGFQANPLPWIVRASALVLTSRYEGLGNVIVEALACGTPVVSTDCPWGPAEILEDGRFGVLAAPGDPFALSSAMRLCLETAWDKARLRDRGARFSAAACADIHLAMFDVDAAKHAPVRQRRVFGLTLSNRSAADIVQTLFDTPAESVCLVVTPNLDHLRHLRSPDFAAAYASATLSCPDGWPILLYARLRGLRLKARVTGCELFHRIAAHSALAEQRLFIVTESQETADAVAGWAERRRLQSSVQVATAPAGLLDDEAAQLELTASIAAYAPRILVMTLGAPTSETFIHRHRDTLPACWALGVGQAVRVELGLAPRASAVCQRFGLEWLWRLCQEPRRLTGRYARSALWFPVAIARDLFGGTASQPSVSQLGGLTVQESNTAS
jgi:exopolysaccharide biosynthesis WecB/TagA/CpsF family protein